MNEAVILWKKGAEPIFMDDVQVGNEDTRLELNHEGSVCEPDANRFQNTTLVINDVAPTDAAVYECGITDPELYVKYTLVVLGRSKALSCTRAASQYGAKGERKTGVCHAVLATRRLDASAVVPLLGAPHAMSLLRMVDFSPPRTRPPRLLSQGNLFGGARKGLEEVFQGGEGQGTTSHCPPPHRYYQSRNRDLWP